MDDEFTPQTHRLTEADAGRTVALHTGDRLAIILPGNPTAGYSWVLAAVDRGVLAPVGEPDYRAASAAIGAGGIFSFEFEAVGAGETAMHLAYRRPWEKRRRPAQTFDVNVTVELC
jgi:inhibitor of cysteine peptidase